MKILFLDQSGKLGGAELCLADIVHPFKANSLVGVFSEGTFPDYLRQRNIPVKILTDQTLDVQKSSGLLAGLKSIRQLLPLIGNVIRLSRQYDVIYTNTQKALVVGAIASLFSRRPLVYHLHDIISPDHFSATNRRIIVTLANRATLIIANSQSSREAFVQAGGSPNNLRVVYNGFHLDRYAEHVKRAKAEEKEIFRNQIASTFIASKTGIENNIRPFIVGHFSRLAPWKGQHVLIEALQHCSDDVVVLFVGDALFGEEDYVQQLHQQVKQLKLERRVRFLSFRSDVPQLMMACDLVAHTSTAPEPFGRVIVEAMLCETPVMAAAAGGAAEIVEPGQTGWLTPPEDACQLADTIMNIYHQPALAQKVAEQGKAMAQRRFDVRATNAQIHQLLQAVLSAGKAH